MSEIKIANIDILRSYLENFNSEKRNYQNNAYQNVFLSSYIARSSNTTVRRIFGSLKYDYDNIYQCYDKISSFFSEYVNDLNAIEQTLSNNGSVGQIRESLIRNSITKLPELKDYHPNFQTLNYAATNNFDFIGENINMTAKYNAAAGFVLGNFIESKIKKLTDKKTTQNLTQAKETNFAKSIIPKSFPNAKDNTSKDNFNIYDLLNANEYTYHGQNSKTPYINIDILDPEKKINNTNSQVSQDKGFMSKLFDSLVKPNKTGLASFASSILNSKTDFDENTNTLVSNPQSTWSNAQNLWEKEVLPSLKEMATDYLAVNNRINATVATAVTSLVEGIASFGEHLYDASEILNSIQMSPITLTFDAVSALVNFGSKSLLDKDLNIPNITSEMWQNTQATVAKGYVTDFLDKFYEGDEEHEANVVGKFFKDTAYGFDTTRSIGKGLGEAAGVIALTVATMGTGTVAIGASASGSVAATQTGISALYGGLSGLGRGSETAWQNGASTAEGLATGIVTGLWDGLQYYVGGKINGLKTFLPKGTADMFSKATDSLPTLRQKLLNSLVKIALDSVDSGVEGFVEPAINLIYQDGYIDEFGNYIPYSQNKTPANLWQDYLKSFDANGGWMAVGTNAAMGAIGSAIGEAFDLKNYHKDYQKLKNLDYEIVRANNAARNGNSYTINVDKITDIPDYLLKQINDNTKVNFKTSDGTIYNFHDVDNILNKKDILNNIQSDLEEKVVNDSVEELIVDGQNVSSIYDITEINLEKLMGLEDKNIKLRLEDGSLVSYEEALALLSNDKLMKNAQFSNVVRNNELSLKEQILSKISGVEDPIEKIRILYMELNKKVHYDMEYVTASEIIKDNIYGTDVNFDNLNKQGNVICKGWSQLMRELLISAGFDESQVRIAFDRLTQDKHRWVEVNLPNNKMISLDATEAINKSTDIIQSRSGNASRGFLFLTQEYSGFRPSKFVEGDVSYFGKVYNESSLFRASEIAQQHLELLDDMQDYLKSLDKKLGYASDVGYTIDAIGEAKDLFGNTSLLSKVFKSADLKQKLDVILNMPIPEGMNGYELCFYYKQIIENYFSIEDKQLLDIKSVFQYINNDTINVLSYKLKGTQYYQVYDAVNGSRIFKNNKDYQEYLKFLNNGN